MRTIHRAGAALALSLAFAAPVSAFDSKSISSSAKLSSFESVYIAPVGIALEEPRPSPRSLSGERPVSEKDAALKAEDFHEDLVDEFGDAFTLASGPGAGVLTIEATLTRLEASRPTIADLREQPGLSMESRYAGGASVAVAFSENGAPLGEVSDSYTETLDNHRFQAGVWEDTDRAFSSWARRLVDFVQKN